MSQMGSLSSTGGLLGWMTSVRQDAGWRRTRRVFTDTEVIYGLMLSGVNTTFLLGKAIAAIPAVITHLAYASLRFIGLLWVHVQMRALLKSGGDLLFALSNHCWTRVYYVTAWAFVQGIGACLTVGGTVAAVAATLAYGSTATWMFMAMRPWGLAALVVQIALDVIAHCTDGPLIDRMREASKSGSRVQAFFGAYQSGAASEAGLAAAARSRMDPNTWKELENKACALLDRTSLHPVFRLTRQWRLRRLFHITIQNLHTQQEEARSNLARTVVGYVAMGVTRAYPQTIVEAIVNWTINLYWTSEMLSRKYVQAGHQESIIRA